MLSCPHCGCENCYTLGNIKASPAHNVNLRQKRCPQCAFEFETVEMSARAFDLVVEGLSIAMATHQHAQDTVKKMDGLFNEITCNITPKKVE